jgi:hypothetical protein
MRANWYLDLGNKYVAARVIHSPSWRFGAGTTRRIKLELPDVLLG